MNRTRVLVNFIQDRSGSMASVWQETVNGFKTFIKDLKEKGDQDGVDYLLSLTVFDTLIETPLLAVSLDEVPEDALAKHGPRGATALYDAAGKMLEAISQASHGADKIIVVIVTDGQENSSREWTKDNLNKAIEDRLNQGHWSFVYLGTQPETWDDAQSIGIGLGAAALYDPNRAAASYSVMASALHAHAQSAEPGTRSLFSRRLNQPEAAAAGMITDPKSLQRPAKSSAGPRGRWR